MPPVPPVPPGLVAGIPAVAVAVAGIPAVAGKPVVPGIPVVAGIRVASAEPAVHIGEQDIHSLFMSMLLLNIKKDIESGHIGSITHSKKRKLSRECTFRQLPF